VAEPSKLQTRKLYAQGKAVSEMKSKNREILQRVSGIIEWLTFNRRTLWTDFLEPCIGLIKEVLDEEPEEPMKEEKELIKVQNRILETRIRDALFTLDCWDRRPVKEWRAFELSHEKELKRKRKRMAMLKLEYGFKIAPFDEVDEVSEDKANKKEIELILKGEFDEED
jgi:hypothetical protein